eukprot:scpid73464/ scgid3057/ E3 ubiquitin-protein ligase RNF185; RING finger protein 185
MERHYCHHRLLLFLSSLLVADVGNVAVITHSWPCIHRWMETERGNQCPVCKAGISEENVVPIYLGGRTADNDDPRKRAPPRPQGQRPAPDPNHAGADGGLFGGGGNNGFHFSLGFGAFPFFGLHATQNFGNPFAAHHHPQQHAQHLHNDPDSVAQRAFLILGVLCVLWLLL